MKILKSILPFISLLSFNYGFSQGNPGFIGKKIAVGYNANHCFFCMEGLIRRETPIPTGRLLFNNEITGEYAVSKYKSLGLNFTFQKVPIDKYSYSFSSGGSARQKVPIGGINRTVNFRRTGGYSDFLMIGLGAKYTRYFTKQTIASPVGFGHYVRLDMYSNKALNNNFVDFVDYNNLETLTEAEKEEALENMDRKLGKTRAISMSLGYGVESKYPISQSVYARVNGELNFSTTIIQAVTSQYTGNDINDDLKSVSKSLNGLRNILLFGIGIGVLL